MSVTVVRRGQNFGLWCADESDKEPWFQVDFGKMMTVKEIETATNDFLYFRVKTYIVKYSYNGQTWYDVSKEGTLTPQV